MHQVQSSRLEVKPISMSSPPAFAVTQKLLLHSKTFKTRFLDNVGI